MRSRSVASVLLEALMQDTFTSSLLNTIAQSVVNPPASPNDGGGAKAKVIDGLQGLLILSTAALIALVGTGLLLTAAYLWLANLMGAMMACAIMGGGMWLIVIGLVLYRSLKRTNSPVPAQNPVDAATEIATKAFAEIKQASTAHPFLTLAAAFGVGMILAQPSPGLSTDPGVTRPD